MEQVRTIVSYFQRTSHISRELCDIEQMLDGARPLCRAIAIA